MAAENNAEYQAILRSLTGTQLRFLSARLDCNTDADAARQIGISTDTPSRWDNKEEIRRAVMLARLDGVELTREMLKRLGPKAVDVLSDEMDGRRNNPQRQKTAVDVLRSIGVDPAPAPQKHEVGGADGGPIVIEVVRRLANDTTGQQSTPGADAGDG